MLPIKKSLIIVYILLSYLQKKSIKMLKDCKIKKVSYDVSNNSLATNRCFFSWPKNELAKIKVKPYLTTGIEIDLRFPNTPGDNYVPSQTPKALMKIFPNKSEEIYEEDQKIDISWTVYNHPVCYDREDKVNVQPTETMTYNGKITCTFYKVRDEEGNIIYDEIDGLDEDEDEDERLRLV